MKSLMKTNKHIRVCLLVFVLNLATGCGKECISAKEDCIDNVLQKRGMVRYTNQDKACRNFLELYRLDEKQYFLLGNNCADMMFRPFDCNDSVLCPDTDSLDCAKFSENAKYVGVIGIQLE
jgi:hypothetical protein